jgi:hypothetical protein
VEEIVISETIMADSLLEILAVIILNQAKWFNRRGMMGRRSLLLLVPSRCIITRTAREEMVTFPIIMEDLYLQQRAETQAQYPSSISSDLTNSQNLRTLLLGIVWIENPQVDHQLDSIRTFSPKVRILFQIKKINLL